MPGDGRLSLDLPEALLPDGHKFRVTVELQASRITHSAVRRTKI